MKDILESTIEAGVDSYIDRLCYDERKIKIGLKKLNKTLSEVSDPEVKMAIGYAISLVNKRLSEITAKNIQVGSEIIETWSGDIGNGNITQMHFTRGIVTYVPPTGYLDDDKVSIWCPFGVFPESEEMICETEISVSDAKEFVTGRVFDSPKSYFDYLCGLGEDKRTLAWENENSER